MKNKLKLLGVIAAVAVIGFSMVGCDNGNGFSGGGLPAILIDSDWSRASDEASLSFDGDDWMHFHGGSSSWGVMIGVSGSTITASSGGSLNFVLSHNNNTMTISNASGAFAGLNGTWTRL